MRHGRWLLAGLCAFLLGAGCTGGGGAAPSSGENTSKKKYRIALIPKGTTHEFWKSVHAGGENAANELGNVEIIWKGPHLENDRDGQISVVQDFTTQKVDGMCLAPLDSQALVPYVQEAAEAGIPVVIFDSALDDDSQIVSYVASDNYHGGVLAARRLADVVGSGNVILLRYNPGSESTEQREKGFLDTLQTEFPAIRVLSSTEYAGTTPEAALDKAQQMLIKYRDEVDGIFAVCEPNSAGVLKALEQEGLAGKVKFVGFDPSKELIEAVREGKMHGIVLQDPVKMGYDAVMALVKKLEGKEVEKRISTGEYVATRANLGESRMKELLNPQQYGE